MQESGYGKAGARLVIVPSLEFLGFAALAALLYNLGWATPAGEASGGKILWRRTVLLFTNLVFFASFAHAPQASLPFAGFLALGYIAQRLTRNGSAPRLFVALLIVTVAAFLWLKRYSFVPSVTYLAFPYLLVGLSYVFFRVLHLIIDSHQREIAEPVGPLSYLNYTLNFTALVSGPIQRYQDYHAMECHPLGLDLVVMGRAVERIIIGYFKVAIVSMLLVQAQHQAIAELSANQPLGAKVFSGFLIAVIYPLYLYANFSGFTDVVIGVARFFRIQLPENFNRPFSSESFLIFWSRWHMTLSNWLKTYVYNPFMLAAAGRITSRNVTPYLGVAAYFVTFFLVGLWHGQTSEFIFFGLLQGGGVAANKLYQIVMQRKLGQKRYRALAQDPLYRALARGLTFTWFTFTLFWFWSNWGQIGHFVNALGATALVGVWLTIFATATLVLAAMEAARNLILAINWNSEPVVRSRYLRTAWGTALTAVTVGVIVLLDSPAPDIVYKSF
jgi:alginate O-acetyltransferase complex protein AlgI